MSIILLANQGFETYSQQKQPRYLDFNHIKHIVQIREEIFLKKKFWPSDNYFYGNSIMGDLRLIHNKSKQIAGLLP